MPGLSLPWGLDLADATGAAGLDASMSYDQAASTLRVSLRNSGAAPARPRQVRLEARLGAPAAEGRAWVHGRYMQKDAFVRAFGGAPLEGYSLDGVRGAGATRSYRSSEQLALVLPARDSPLPSAVSKPSATSPVRTRPSATSAPPSTSPNAILTSA